MLLMNPWQRPSWGANLAKEKRQACKDEEVSIVLKKNEHDRGCRRPLRVAFLAIMPAPYMVDLFEAIHRDARFCLKVYFLEKPAVAAPGVYWQEKPLPPYASVLPGGWFFFSRARVHLNTGLFAAITRDRPDVVVVMAYKRI